MQSRLLSGLQARKAPAHSSWDSLFQVWKSLPFRHEATLHQIHMDLKKEGWLFHCSASPDLAHYRYQCWILLKKMRMIFLTSRLIVRILQLRAMGASHKENPTGFGYCCNTIVSLAFTPTCHGIDTYKRDFPITALRNGLSNQSPLDQQGEGSVNQLDLIKAIIGGFAQGIWRSR